jgi:hypothetical protein
MKLFIRLCWPQNVLLILEHGRFLLLSENVVELFVDMLWRENILICQY